MTRPGAPKAWFSIALSLALVMSDAPAAWGTDGDLDGSFGDGGTVLTAFPVGSFATAVAIQPDGKIVAVGAAAGPSETGEFAVARYEADGSLDTTFGEEGMVTTPIAGGGDEARSVAIQQDGRIVVVGTDSWRRFAAVRYRPDGELDPSFGGDGIVVTNFAGEDMAWDLAIQPNGKIVVIGSAGYGQRGFRLVRYRRDGAPDPTFGDQGKVVTTYHGAVARSVALQPDGRIVVAGYQPGGLALARYRRNGRLDRSFDRNGTIASMVSPVWALAVALQPNGRVVVAGGYDFDQFGLSRFRGNGSLDRTFGDDGVVRTQVEGVEQGANGLVIGPGGTIVATGSSGPHEYGDPTVSRFVLIRYLRDGHLDPTFGDGGTVATFFEGGAYAHGSAADALRRIVVVGGAGEGNREAFALARYV